jgi:RimJ/RimL family protein N-acetyltransferase
MSRTLITPKGPVTFRFAVASDADVVRELRLEALFGHPEAFASDYETTAPRPLESWTAQIVDTSATGRGQTCIANADKSVGMATIIRGDRIKTEHSAGIHGVYVRAGWRGHHIAQALIDECLEWARAQGVEIAKLAVVTTNVSAIRCYSRCGFAVYGVEPRVIRHAGTAYDELLMARTL